MLPSPPCLCAGRKSTVCNGVTLYLTNPRVDQVSGCGTTNRYVDSDGVALSTATVCITNGPTGTPPVALPDTYDLTTSSGSDTVQVCCLQVRRLAAPRVLPNPETARTWAEGHRRARCARPPGLLPLTERCYCLVRFPTMIRQINEVKYSWHVSREGSASAHRGTCNSEWRLLSGQPAS